MQILRREKIALFLIFTLGPISFLIQEFTFIKIFVILVGLGLYFTYRAPAMRISSVVLFIILLQWLMVSLGGGNACTLSNCLIYILIFLLSMAIFDGERPLHFLFAAALIISIVGLFQALSVIPAPRDFYGKRDLSSIMGLSNYSAHFIGPILLPLIHMVIKRKRAYLWVFILIIVAYTLLTKNRALYVALFLSSSFLIYSLWAQTFKRRAIFITIFLTVLVAALLSPPLQSILKLKDPSARLRYYTYIGTVKLIIDHPLGTAGRFEILFPEYKPEALDKQLITSKTWVNNPHNELLYWGADAGLIGIAFYLYIWIVFLTSLKKKKLSPWIAGGILTGLIQSLGDFNLHTPGGALAFFYLFFSYLETPLSGPEPSSYKRFLLPLILTITLLCGTLAITYSFSELSFRKGKFFYEKGLLVPAKEELKKSVDLFPCRWNALTLLGNIYKKEGFLHLAEQYYSMSFGYNPNFLTTIQHFGYVEYKLGKPDQAVKIWERGMELSPYMRVQFASRIFPILYSEKKYDKIKKIMKKYPELLEKDDKLRYYFKKYPGEQGGR